ncbi:MAG: bifunctional aspartate kinase/homoserine dehydrogenase I [Longimicrobiales bacterium]
MTAAPPASPTVAHKFGGSSLADAACIAHVAALLLERPAPQVVVVSAMKGVTDALIGLAATAGEGDERWRADLDALFARHERTAEDLLGDDARSLAEVLAREKDALRGLLEAVALMGRAGPDLLDVIQGLGEVYASRLVEATLAHRGADVTRLDAREVLVVRTGELGAAVDWDASASRLAAWRKAFPAERVVVTGFVARDPDGRIVTLGRDGSDYSGAIFAALFDASELHIWTDVDGVFSADPRIVPESELVPHLSYDEACELAYFGARVIHPQTMAPAIRRSIPIYLRSTFRPDHPGTRIVAATAAGTPVKGFSAVEGLALVNVEGAGMIGVPGTAERVFGALRDAGISVVMISQGSSEHSICLVVREGDAPGAVHALEETFARELARGQIQSVEVTPDVAVLAAVGDGMAGTPGIAARLFTALARASINVRAIAQGASERNISVAISGREARRAVRAAHAAFYLSPQTVSIGVVGPGQVGRALVAQIAAARERLLRDANLDLRVRAISDSRRWLMDDVALPLDGWREALAAADAPADLDAMADHVHASHLPHAALVDCTASDAVADRYEGWLAAGLHVITPNKHLGAGDLDRYRRVQGLSRRGPARFRYEATVGAGLPVVQTLRDLIDTGDEIHTIEGVLSGSLAWLFTRFDGSVSFSELVREARAAGYTEPDPREDLSGMDVARKLVILAREQGLDLTLDQVVVESLVPAALEGVGPDAFLAGLDALDEPMAEALAAARAEGAVLRFVAHLDREGRATVGLARLPAEHAFAGLRLTDNVVQYTTARYRDNPLVVQGPGAGPEVTAAGVFADLLRIASTLGGVA